MTARQQAFATEFGVDRCATQAAIRAGYSPKTAYAQGSRLMRNAEVAAAVRQADRRRAAATEITAENVLRAIAGIAFDETAHPRDQMRGLELLARNLALLTDRVEHSGSVELLTVDAVDAEIARLAAEMDNTAAEVEEPVT